MSAITEIQIIPCRRPSDNTCIRFALQLNTRASSYISDHTHKIFAIRSDETEKCLSLSITTVSHFFLMETVKLARPSAIRRERQRQKGSVAGRAENGETEWMADTRTSCAHIEGRNRIREWEVNGEVKGAKNRDSICIQY